MTEYYTLKLQRTRSRLDPDADNFDSGIPDDDFALLRKFDEELDADPDKGAVAHTLKLNSALAFSNARDEHGLSLETLLTGGDDPEAVTEQFKKWLNTRRIPASDGGTKKMSATTRTHYRKMAREFGRHLTRGDDLPDHLEVINANAERSDDYDPTPHPSTILYWDDHLCPILDHPEIYTRDKAICAVSWDSGGRPSEIHRLTFGDIEDKNTHIVVTLWEGKTGTRTRRLICSMPYLRLWIREHPVNDELPEGANTIEDAPDETPLWTHLDENVKYESNFIDICKDVGEKQECRDRRIRSSSGRVGPASWLWTRS